MMCAYDRLEISRSVQLDMVIVATADPLEGQYGDNPWKLEKANLDLAADFISSLPGA